MDDIAKVLERIRSNGHDLWIEGPASSGAVAELEEAMGFPLSSSLRSFLLQYGAMGISDCFISGIIENNPLEMSGGNIYADTIFLREDFPDMPANLWVIEKHEDGAYCLDTHQKTQGGEYAIVNFEGTEYASVANAFQEFFLDWFLKGWAENSE